jgi:hypothetical protein
LNWSGIALIAQGPGCQARSDGAGYLVILCLHDDAARESVAM